MTTAAPFGPGSNPGVDLPPALSRFAIRSTAAGPIFASVEFLFLSLAPYLGSLTYHGIVMPLHLPPDHLMLTVGVVMASLYILMSHPRGSFDLDELKSVSLRGPLVQWSLAFMFFTMASFALKIGDVFSRGGILTGFVMGASAIVILRLAVPITVRMANQYRLLEGRRAVLLSDGAPTPGAMTPRDLDAAGYAVQSWFRVPALGQQQTPAQVERLCSDIVNATRQQRVEEIVLVADAFRQPLIADILDRLRVVPLRVLLLRSPEARSQPQHAVGRRIKLSAIEVQAAPLSRGEWFAKRCLDVTAATALLLLASPVLAAIAIMIRLDSKGPILFRQTRVGYAGRTFMIFKFRSMYTTDNGPVVKQAERGDVRITRVGRFLRETSLDELPQLLNVIIGDMSLVGPRPHAAAHDQHYERLIPAYAWRHHALPGITGWAQVNGHRGETPTLASMEARVEHDLWYVRNWSLWLDLRILARTVRAVLRPTNAY